LGSPPLIAVFLPAETYSPPPSLQARILAEEKALRRDETSYYAFMKHLNQRFTQMPVWRFIPFNPSLCREETPSARLSAAKRLEFLLGGSVKARLNKRIGGSAGECAAAIIDYLQAEGIITAKEH
jgi:hypothetical protein